MRDDAASTKRRLRVAIVEDEPLFRDMLRIAIEQHPGYHVAACYAHSDDAAAGLLKQDFGACGADRQMDGMSPFDQGLDQPHAVHGAAGAGETDDDGKLFVANDGVREFASRLDHGFLPR